MGLETVLRLFLNYQLQKGLAQTKYVLGANMAFYKKDIIAVNGYNESFTGWGKEDNDLALRLFLNGTTIRFIKYNAIIYHLYHKEASKTSHEANNVIFNKTKQDKIIFAPKGIDQYL